MSAVCEAWDRLKDEQSARIKELYYQIAEWERRRDGLQKDEDIVEAMALTIERHKMMLEFAGLPANSLADLRFKIRALNDLIGVQSGGWRDDIDTRLVHSIALDAEKLLDG